MSKLPKNLEDPIDILMADLSGYISPTFKYFGFTPNLITTLSLIFALASIYYLLGSEFKKAGILFFASYFFDCLDGYFARKYDMTTQFGDYYDHIVDILKGTIVYTFIIIFLYQNDRIFLIILFIFVIVIQAIYIGCQERYVSYVNPKINSEMLGLVSKTCTGTLPEVTNKLTYLRYIGCGTAMALISILIYNLDKLKK